MPKYTLEDFRTTLRDCTGLEDHSDLEGDIIDTEFTDLGFDSLLVYEIATRLQDEYKVTIPDDAIDDLKTPRGFIDYLNERLPV